MEHHRQPGKRRFRPGRDWLVSGLILIGGILCGIGASFAFFYAGHHWLGVRLIDWYPWWGFASVISTHFVASVFVLAATRYWLRRRNPDNQDPGA